MRSVQFMIEEVESNGLFSWVSMGRRVSGLALQYHSWPLGRSDHKPQTLVWACDWTHDIYRWPWMYDENWITDTFTPSGPFESTAGATGLDNV